MAGRFVLHSMGFGSVRALLVFSSKMVRTVLHYRTLYVAAAVLMEHSFHDEQLVT